MVVIKYKKTGLGAFIGEEEMLDCWNRVMNRAGLNLDEGDFKLKLFHPAPLGIESNKEYLIVNTSLNEDKVKIKIQELFPDWIEIVDCYRLDDFDLLFGYKTRDILHVSIANMHACKNSIEEAFNLLKNEGKVIDYSFEDKWLKVAISSILSNSMCDIVGEILRKNNIRGFTIIREKLLLENDALMEVDSFLEEEMKGVN